MCVWCFDISPALSEKNVPLITFDIHHSLTSCKIQHLKFLKDVGIVCIHWYYNVFLCWLEVLCSLCIFWSPGLPTQWGSKGRRVLHVSSEFMGKTFQAAQLTHERFLTIDHSCKIFFEICQTELPPTSGVYSKIFWSSWASNH